MNQSDTANCSVCVHTLYTYLYFDHEDHVLLVVLDGLLEEGLHLLGELARVLMAQPTNVLALKTWCSLNGRGLSWFFGSVDF